MTDTDPLEMNPYRPPQTVPVNAESDCKFQHRNFRLTLDDIHENRHFVIGSVRGAIIFSFLQQMVWMILMAQVSDGRLLRLAALASFVFWSLIVITAVVQRGNFSSQQTLATKWGYMPIFLIVVNVVNVIVVVSIRL